MLGIPSNSVLSGSSLTFLELLQATLRKAIWTTGNLDKGFFEDLGPKMAHRLPKISQDSTRMAQTVPRQSDYPKRPRPHVKLRPQL